MEDAMANCEKYFMNIESIRRVFYFMILVGLVVSGKQLQIKRSWVRFPGRSIVGFFSPEYGMAVFLARASETSLRRRSR